MGLVPAGVFALPEREGLETPDACAGSPRQRGRLAQLEGLLTVHIPELRAPGRSLCPAARSPQKLRYGPEKEYSPTVGKSGGRAALELPSRICSPPDCG